MIPAGTLLGDTQVSLPGAPVAGQVDPDGRLVNLGKLEGWWNPPASSGSSTQRVNAPGVTLGPGFYGGRSIVLEARVDGLSPVDSLATARRFLQAIDPDALVTLSVTDGLETLSARVRQDQAPSLVRQGNRAVVSLSLIAPDPNRYAPAQTAETYLPSTTGGLTLGGGAGASLPLSLAATQATGVIVVTNTGDAVSYPVFTVYGPCSTCTITDADGRQLYVFDSVPAGRTLVIDTAPSARTAVLDGTAVRVVAGTWPILKPGENQYRFNADSFNAASRLVVSYRSARR